MSLPSDRDPMTGVGPIDCGMDTQDTHIGVRSQFTSSSLLGLRGFSLTANCLSLSLNGYGDCIRVDVTVSWSFLSCTASWWPGGNIKKITVLLPHLIKQVFFFLFLM